MHIFSNHVFNIHIWLHTDIHMYILPSKAHFLAEKRNNCYYYWNSRCLPIFRYEVTIFLTLFSYSLSTQSH